MSEKYKENIIENKKIISEMEMNEIGDGNIDLVLAENGRSKSLNEFLPEGWHFREAPEGDFGFYCVIPEKIIYLAWPIVFQHPPRLSNRLRILHEIGHAIDAESQKTGEKYDFIDKLPPEEVDFLQENRGVFLTYEEFDLFKEVFPNLDIASKRVSSEQLKEFQLFVKNNSEAKTKLERAFDALYDNEANAWERAKELYEVFKQEGFSFVDRAVSENEVQKIVDLRLGKYIQQILLKIKEYGLEETTLAEKMHKELKVTEEEMLSAGYDEMIF